MPTLALPITPDPDDPACTQIFLSAVADGEQLRMLLDSGARRSSVPATGHLARTESAESLHGSGDSGPGGADFAESVQDVVTPASESRGVSGATTGNPIARLGRLQLGPLDESGLYVEFTPPGEPPFGLLGADVLRRHRWHFRFSAETADIDGEQPQGCFLLEIEPPEGAPTVELRAGDTMVRAVWDTGAGTTVVDRSWARAHPDAVTLLGESADGLDSTNAAVASERGRLAPVRIGGYGFPASDCVVVDLAPLNQHLDAPLEIILGLPLLQLADWWFDFPTRAWAITKAPA